MDELKEKLDIFDKDLVGELPDNDEINDFISDVWGYEYGVVSLVKRFLNKKDKEEIKKELMNLQEIMRSMKDRFDKLKFNDEDVNELKGKERFVKLYELYEELIKVVSIKKNE